MDQVSCACIVLCRRRLRNSLIADVLSSLDGQRCRSASGCFLSCALRAADGETGLLQAYCTASGREKAGRRVRRIWHVPGAPMMSHACTCHRSSEVEHVPYSISFPPLACAVCICRQLVGLKPKPLCPSSCQEAAETAAQARDGDMLSKIQGMVGAASPLGLAVSQIKGRLQIPLRP